MVQELGPAAKCQRTGTCACPGQECTRRNHSPVDRREKDERKFEWERLRITKWAALHEPEQAHDNGMHVVAVLDR